MKNKEFEVDIVRRHELLHALLNHKESVDDHLIRIRFELKNQCIEALTGALVDFFIVTSAEDVILRRDILRETMHLLDTDWLLLFYDNLEENFNSVTIVPYNRWSLLTENVQGNFHYIDNPYVI